MAKRLIRERALREAVEIFKKQNSDGEEASQDKLVGAVQKTQRTMGLGTHIVPQPSRSMEDEMKRKGPENMYGHKVFSPGYVDYESPTEFDVHPAMMGCLGHLGSTFVALYRNNKVKVDLDAKEATKSKAMANNIKRQAEFQQKPVKKMAESWLATNSRRVDATTAFHTLRELNLGQAQRPVDTHSYNFSAGAIKPIFQ